MLEQVADDVFVFTSECLESNTFIVQGEAGVLLIDPGLTTAELEQLADELPGPVVAAFSTHPHWDHVLWHPALGDAPRYGTERNASYMRELLARPDWVEQIAEGLPPEIAGEVPMHLLGQIEGLVDDVTEVPWNGPTVRILRHDAHSAGHASLLIVERGVLVAGDMLSDVLVPMLGLHEPAADHFGDYLTGLDLLGSVEADIVIPGHGSVGDAAALAARLTADRAYVEAVRDGLEVDDPRIGADAKPGWEWVAWVHESQVDAAGAS